MAEGTADKQNAQQVEFAVQQLKSLSIFPSNFNKLFLALNNFQLTPADLVQIVESDPAIAIELIRLCRIEQPGRDCPSINSAIEILPLRRIRDSVLQMKIYSDKPNMQQTASLSFVPGLEFRKDLTIHSIAVGFTARHLADTAVDDIDPDTAYLAGLLHDIGKFALDEAMPKSFTRIIELAEKQQCCSCDIELQNLGTDHTVLGKRLAARWQMPEHIILPIWLHHSDLSIVRANLPAVRLAQLVQLADLLTRQLGLGKSGSFDEPQVSPGLLESLRIDSAYLEQIKDDIDTDFEKNTSLPVSQAAEDLGSLCDSLQQTASLFAQQYDRLSQQIDTLQVQSNCLKFISSFLSALNPQMQPADMARAFTESFISFYQTGPVCLFLTPAADSVLMPAVVAADNSQSRLLLLQSPAEKQTILISSPEKFEFLAPSAFDWLFGQIEMTFEPAKTKAAPVISNGKNLAILVFEQRQPVSDQQLLEILQTITRPLAAVLILSSRAADQQQYAELFARFKPYSAAEAKPQPPLQEKIEQTKEQKIEEEKKETPVSNDRIFAYLAEMAAGAAHELNNPLVVISGRAQLLEQTEEDEQKKKMLSQISDNAKEVSRIIDELMSFASPAPPTKQKVIASYLIETAVGLASIKAKKDTLNVQITPPRR